MNQDNILKENTKVILNSIVSANKNLHMKIKKQYPNLTGIQVYTSLLLELGYTSNEIRIILGITTENIVEVVDLISNPKLSEY